ncbi:glycosyltransferase family 2 protein [Flavobacterium capsici]|uniref:Glycosyltransferase family 2 protein n=1 Tax=Flavobacterium capsici TaxID=3075618 RepID=A0AA96EZN8_9FLAO|nr:MULTISPECIES: glycosyltransferase family 2 protein [unclassified Flavobacterium]WNM20228.1 glycosyltransferase family 2 protein [Flavobacterium sp. PMR2A8]WNM21618.1 glycosyltransferase family 2 protein [Flavobacterium sp. PMTSA4]
MNNPLVSVIIPTYKRSDFLIRALESVLKQTYSPIEIIVVDDNDGDNEFRLATAENIKSYIEKNLIQYYKHDFNKGLPAARNTGISHANGEFIAFLDDDDEFLPDKTRLQVDCFLNNNSNVGLVYGSFIRFETDSNTERIIRPKHAGDLQTVLGLNHIGPPSMVMCRKEAVVKVNGFDGSFRSREDIEFYYRIAKYYEVEYVSDIIMKYYIHPNTMSKIHADKLLYMVRFIDKFNDELKKPKARWSEIQERLGELYAVNNKRQKAFKTLLNAYINNPKRVSILIKAILAVLGDKIYKKIRNVV